MESETPTPGGPVRLILFVAEDRALSRVVKEYLSYFKIRVIPAHDYDEAIDWLGRGEYDAYVLDAEFSGVERLGALLEANLDRVVLVCGEAEPTDWVSSGLRHRLNKPFDVAELQLILAGILSRRDASDS